MKGEILKEPILQEIAGELNKSPAQVALRWGLQSGHSILPKSVNESRISENFNLFDWSIPPKLFSRFSNIHQVNNLQYANPMFRISSASLNAEKLIYIVKHAFFDAAKASPGNFCRP